MGWDPVGQGSPIPCFPQILLMGPLPPEILYTITWDPPTPSKPIDISKRNPPKEKPPIKGGSLYYSDMFLYYDFGLSGLSGFTLPK